MSTRLAPPPGLDPPSSPPPPPPEDEDAPPPPSPPKDVPGSDAPSRKVAPPPGLGPGVDNTCEELKKFMAWKNPSFPEEHVPMILQMFTLRDIAEAIRDKYGMVPQGWRAILESDVIAKHLPKGLSRGSLKPGDMEPKSGPTASMSDLKINEILDSEARFVGQITELQDKYLDKLYKVWDGSKQNKDAAKALGLTQEEATQIFEQLGSIVRFSQNLLSRLELISMVRKQPITGEGRAIHVGRAFIAMAPKLHVYAPAITSYQNSLAILNEAVNRLPKYKTSGHMNFIELWEKVTATNDILRGQQLQAVLITPMQRVPRYKMLLEQLLKDCDHPDAIPVIKEALDLFSSAATNINEALRKHEKLMAFFGKDEKDLKPVSSSGSVVDGVVKVSNQYNAKNL